MGSYIGLIVFVLIVGTIAIVVDRRWLSAESGKEGEGGAFSSLPLLGKSQKKLGKKFQAWAAEAIPAKEKDLKNWIETFSPKEANAFAKQVATFCADLNLDLAWLIDDKLAKNPNLEKPAKNMVISYCAACWQAAETQEDLKAFGTFQAMMKKPSTKQHKALSQKLFAELADQGMTPADSLKLYVASDKKKQARIAMEAIEQAAESDPVKFNNILKQVLQPDEDTEAADGQSPSLLSKVRGIFGKKSTESAAPEEENQEESAPAAEKAQPAAA